MTALERKLVNQMFEFLLDNNTHPKYIECTIRLNDGDFVENMVFATYPYDCDNEENDDRVFFYLDKPDYILPMLANIDFIRDDFCCMDDFMQEVDKYDTNDQENEDWSYLHRGEDFCIVDITGMFNEI